MQKQIPISIVTGYLGSGKTTLINHILTNSQGIKTAVIVNDIGEVNIDAELIEKNGVISSQGEDLVALSNGCICCTLRKDLIEQIMQLVNSNNFDNIIIEASGICEPIPIAQTICYIEESCKKHFGFTPCKLDAVISVVDSLRMSDEFENGNTLLKENDEDDIANIVINQIEFCDVLILNKTSLISEEKLNQVRQIVRALQPNAKLIETDFSNVDLKEILNTNLFDFEKAITSAGWLTEFENDKQELESKNKNESEDTDHECECGNHNEHECHYHEDNDRHSEHHNYHSEHNNCNLEHNNCHSEHGEESHSHNDNCHCHHEHDEECTCGDDCHCHDEEHRHEYHCHDEEYDHECRCHEHNHCHSEHSEESHCHCHKHHHHGENCTCNACRGEADEFKINTYVYYRRKPFNREKFEAFMDKDFGRKIIRTKGMVYFDDEKDSLYIYEQAGKQKVLENNGLFYASLPEEQLTLAKQDPKFMEIWDDEYGDRMIKLVFIGQNLNKNEIKSTLDRKTTLRCIF